MEKSMMFNYAILKEYSYKNIYIRTILANDKSKYNFHVQLSHPLYRKGKYVALDSVRTCKEAIALHDGWVRKIRSDEADQFVPEYDLTENHTALHGPNK